mmetsp:Transcript_105223/g.328045  ORF Transcript_105223/g.328045 Transcript_105223/m.328045 type:complete len:209 (-) Transcript_105223:114-740(-)
MTARRLGSATRICSATQPSLAWPRSTPQGSVLGNVGRRFHVMKNSWPSLRQPPDPSKPSVSRVIRQMDSNKNAGEERASAPSRRTHARHLPDCVYPAAAATPAAVSAPSAAGAGRAPRAPAGLPPPNWRPPGWEAIAQQRGVGPGVKAPRKKKDTLGEDRPAFEVWGMRIVAVLLIGVVYVELSTVSWGPTGLTRKPRGRPQPEPEQR